MHNSAPLKEPKTRIPGEEGIWILVIGDMILFAIFFFVYLYERAQQIEIFDAAQKNLNLGFGFANTILLLTSSWFVVTGLQLAREQRLSKARGMLILAMLCGLGFAVNKVWEWSVKVGAGQGPSANDFYMLFFVFTGIHFFHMVIGMVVLFFMWRRLNRAVIEADDMVMLESSASFWHLVDLLWIVLFVLLYLVHS